MRDPHGTSPLIFGRVRLTVVHPNCVRIEQAPDGTFVDEPSLFARQRPSCRPAYNMTRHGEWTIIDTGAMRLRYLPDGQPLSARNLTVENRAGDPGWTWQPGQHNTGNLGGTAPTLDGWVAGKALSDGLLSRDGWFLLDDSRGPLLTDGWVRSRGGSGQDWYLFGYGLNFRAAFQALAAVSGNMPLPRRYVLGAWYSRYWKYTADDFKRIVEEYCEKEFPLDVLVMDMDWHVTEIPEEFRQRELTSPPGWTAYTWNRKLIPAPEELLCWLHDRGLHVTLNDHPADGIQPFEDMYAAFMRDMGENPAAKKTLPFDAADRHYLETFYHHTHAPLDQSGVDFWWLDWQQGEHTRSVPELTNIQWLNYCYYHANQTDGLRGQAFSRWGGWGDHRHPIHFSGDAHTGWKMLAFEVPFTSVSGNVGCFLWSHDIGGHKGPRNEESYARWCQFGALSAALRSHSNKDPGKDRRPWTSPKWAEDSMRRSFHLRSTLFPYIYSSVAQSCCETVPLTRPMYIDHPAAEEAYRNPQQYLFGDHLLVAPIAAPGAGPRFLANQAVWFPGGIWYNYFTGERFEGTQERLVSAEIDEFPLYVRGGAPIAMQPYQPRMGTALIGHLVIRCWPGDDGVTTRTELYEDDGVTEGYARGESARTGISCLRRGETVVLTVAATVGAFAGQLEERRCTIELPETEPPRAAFVNGAPVPVRYDAATRTTRLELPAQSIRDELRGVVEAGVADPAKAAAEAFARRAGLARATGSVVGMLARALKQGTPEQRELARRAAGIDLFNKNETLYGHPDTPNYFIYAPKEFRVGSAARLGFHGAERKIRLAGTKTPVDFTHLCRDIPRPPNELLFPQTAAQVLKGSLTIAGQQVGFNKEVVFDLPPWNFQRNLAPRAIATASSVWMDQPVSGAIDGVVDGMPGSRFREWASNRERDGAWLKLQWPKPVKAGRILLYDRPNEADHVLAGKILLSDGTVLDVGELPADAKTAFDLKFKPRQIKWLVFVITAVSERTAWSGISEIAVFAE